MSVTAHFIDKDGKIIYTILEFIRFITPHTGEYRAEFSYELIKKWGLDFRISTITTYNYYDIFI